MSAMRTFAAIALAAALTAPAANAAGPQPTGPIVVVKHTRVIHVHRHHCGKPIKVKGTTLLRCKPRHWR